jgi:exonuclease SbcD
MRIIHTADWHLGDRLGRVDRTADLRRAVEEIAGICAEHSADVLIICGDLFSELNRADTLRHSVEHLNETFRQFLCGGGTILAITGNHDNEHFAQVLRQAMMLAAPSPEEPGDLVAGGRFYLFPAPTLLRLAGRDGAPVQFVLMPWPSPSRYLDEQGQKYQSMMERDRALRVAFKQRLDAMFVGPRFDRRLPTVVAAHIATAGAELCNGQRIGEDGIVVAAHELPAHVAYVALGDIHRPQTLMGLSHVRYSGSIDRMDLGETDEEKGVIMVDIGPGGRQGEPLWVPLRQTTPIYQVVIEDAARDFDGMPERYPDRRLALVKVLIRYRPGHDDLNAALAKADRIFPRCYAREWHEIGAASENGTGPVHRGPARSFADTVGDYLRHELKDNPDRDELLALAEALLAEEEQPA